ncbi:MAG: plastocyanin/azurin family copper-binding protein [Acidimicrobiales bacterium]
MRRTWLCAISALALVGAACGGGGESATDDPGSTGSTSGEGASGGSAVEMSLIAYKPAKLTVSPGTTVTWTQKDAGFHTVTSGTVTQGGSGVTSNSDGKFSSANLEKGETYEFEFSEPGTFPYFCEIHPATMTGEVTVA